MSSNELIWAKYSKLPHKFKLLEVSQKKIYQNQFHQTFYIKLFRPSNYSTHTLNFRSNNLIQFWAYMGRLRWKRALPAVRQKKNPKTADPSDHVKVRFFNLVCLCSWKSPPGWSPCNIQWRSRRGLLPDVCFERGWLMRIESVLIHQTCSWLVIPSVHCHPQGPSVHCRTTATTVLYVCLSQLRSSLCFRLTPTAIL